jgi:hypothetical protein
MNPFPWHPVDPGLKLALAAHVWFDPVLEMVYAPERLQPRHLLRPEQAAMGPAFGVRPTERFLPSPPVAYRDVLGEFQPEEVLPSGAAKNCSHTLQLSNSKAARFPHGSAVRGFDEEKRVFTLQTHDLANCTPQLPKYLMARLPG